MDEEDEEDDGTTSSGNSDARKKNSKPATIIPIQIIPPLMQLYPEVEVEYADDTNSLAKRASDGKWTWVFAGRTLYLVGPQPGSGPCSSNGSSGADVLLCPHSSKMRVLHSKHVAPLLATYLKESENCAN